MKPGDLVVVSSEYGIAHPAIILSVSQKPDPCTWIHVLTSTGTIHKVNAFHAKVINEAR